MIAFGCIKSGIFDLIIYTIYTSDILRDDNLIVTTYTDDIVILS